MKAFQCQLTQGATVHVFLTGLGGDDCIMLQSQHFHHPFCLFFLGGEGEGGGASQKLSTNCLFGFKT